MDPRARVWIALSDLYLDTDTNAFLASCARALAASSFSRDELRTILLDEVHPVLASNLLSVAGVWDGFDTAWLCAQIRRHRRAWWAPLNPMRYYRRRDFRARWLRLDAIITTLRSADPHA